jgi:tetratricopeptide (TPR) repeat protein
MKRLLLLVLGLVSCSAPPTPMPEEPRATIEDYTRAIEQRKNDAPLYLARGMLHVQAQRYKSADDDFTEAIRIAPDYVEAYLRRGAIRQGADAARDRAEARRLGAGQADGYYNEGVRAYNQGRVEEAERMWRFAVDLQPFHSRAHVAIARLYLQRRQFVEAAVEFDQAIPIGSEDAELFYYRGNARIAAGRGEEALTDFSKAVELDPSEPMYYTARGLALQRVRGDRVRARANFDEAIRVDPNCHAAWLARGVLLHESKELEAAENDLRRAATIRATPEGCLALGRVLHDRGAYDKALSLYRGAIEIYKDSPLVDALRHEEERTRHAKEKQ